MAPRKVAPKRKPTSASKPSMSRSKRPRADDPGPSRQPDAASATAGGHEIILQRYYPAEITNNHARGYADGRFRRPIEELQAALEETADRRQSVHCKDAVVHWFKMDLRLKDNRSLSLASNKAKAAGIPLICTYLVSPQDFEAHLMSPSRVDFMLRSLEILKRDLAKLDIPLYVETVEARRNIPDRIHALMDEWGASHLFANMEYEVDELRREARMVRSLAMRGKSFQVVHDTCVVPPGSLQSGAGKQYAVYSPWYKSWMAHIRESPDLLELCRRPSKNPNTARQQLRTLFECPLPEAPESKSLNDEEKRRFSALWPCGEHAAWDLLEQFFREKVAAYASDRNVPSANCSSSLSVYLASGTISARTCVRTAMEKDASGELDAGKGIHSWISEVAWRDFYRHVLTNWPHVCMNKPYKLEFCNIEWSYNNDHLAAWCEGRTGFPIVDAAMRQLNQTGYMHNRCRMVVASFLAKDLLIDWRHGERYFMEHLIDGDFASNSGGWGFSASVGIDPQPYFRIFNPLLQSERFDPNGDYIRQWIPELREVEGKAIHEPYERGADDLAREAGYPEPIVDHKSCRERALTAYKNAMSSGQ